MELVFELISNIFSDNKNIYIWIILFMIVLFISEIKINDGNIKEKFFISYLLFIVLRFLGLIPIKFILCFSIPFYFIFIELIFNKERNKIIISNPFLYVFDYLYIMVFKYHILGFLLSLFVISEYFYGNVLFFFEDSEITYYCLGILSILIYLYTINEISNNKFNTLSFNEIFDKMESILTFRNYTHDKRLEPFADILTWYEDRSYLYRKNSFNLINFDYIVFKFNRVISNRKSKIYDILFIGGFIRDIVTFIVILFKVLIYIMRSIKNKFCVITNIILRKRKFYSIRTIIRGHSTIEMQLLRTLALKDGYENTIQRKFYELFYTSIFFKSLKHTYRYYVYNNLDEFKYYLLELYIRVVPTFINGKRYNNINSLFKDRDNIFELTNEEFFLFTLGLSNKDIEFSKIDDYHCPVELDRMRYVKAFEEVLGYQMTIVPDVDGLSLNIMLFDNINCKRFPINLSFDSDKKLIDVIKYIKDYYCDRGMEAIISNIVEVLYGNCVSNESLKLLNIPIIDNNGKFTDIFDLTISDLEKYCDIHNKTINITYNCSIGVGGTVGYENGIRYFFHNNEKNIHVDLPHINCKYAEEEIRINLMTFEVMDEKKFKSPVKTKEAIKYIKNNQEMLLDIWDNVVDKDNVLNKKIKNIYLK